MTTIHYTLYGETVDVCVTDAPAGHRDEFLSRGYEWNGRGWSKLIVGRDIGTVEAKWLKATFPSATLDRDTSGGGVA